MPTHLQPEFFRRLDDSDDETVDIVRRAVGRWRSRGVDVRHIRRSGRSGYKAGALAEGLTLTDAPFLAVFDADFEWALANRTGLEQYFKPWPRLRRMVGGVERFLPRSMWMGLVVFARRRPS